VCDVCLSVAGCLPLLIQLLHGSGPGTDGLFGSMRGCSAARVRAAQALRNIVTSNPDCRRSRREERVLQLLEQIRSYADSLAPRDDVDDAAEDDDGQQHNDQQRQHIVSVLAPAVTNHNRASTPLLSS